jgi:hypothetical protein
MKQSVSFTFWQTGNAMRAFPDWKFNLLTLPGSEISDYWFAPTVAALLLAFDVCRAKKDGLQESDLARALIITAEVTAANGIFPSAAAKKKMKEHFMLPDNWAEKLDCLLK